MSDRVPKPLIYAWDKRYADDYWYPLGNWIEHSHDLMAEFSVCVETPSDDVETARKNEAALSQTETHARCLRGCLRGEG